MRNRNIILIVSGVTIMVIALTVAVVSCRTSSAAPAPVSTEQVEYEDEDCDDEDRTKKQWMECGLGVLDPKKTTKPPAPKTPATKKTRR